MQSEEANEVDLAKKNQDVLHKLVTQIDNLPKGSLLKIKLTGHADETSISETQNSYLSNYELSEARTQITKAEILTALKQSKSALQIWDEQQNGNKSSSEEDEKKWKNIEWNLLSHSNERFNSIFKNEDIISVDELNKSVQDKSPLSIYVLSTISDGTRKLSGTDSDVNAGDLLKASLNRLILGKSLYDKKRFEKVPLSEETKEILTRNKPEEVPYLNRLLLEDSYPGSLRRLNRCPALNGDNSKNSDENIKGSCNRTVEASVEAILNDPMTAFLSQQFTKPPDLMDYIYFSIYTITTTGYGDIKPASRYAKFLVSLENFFEVFFLVCFMNTLIALKSEPKLMPDTDSDGPFEQLSNQTATTS